MDAKIIQELYDSGLTQTEIGCRFNCSKQSVYQFMKNNGIRARSVRRHGMAGTPIYAVWCTMIARCTNPNSTSYPLYGARGIMVCDRWLAFENFFADMGNQPSGMSLDRLNSNGAYSPDNCRWATMVEQQNNRRDTRRVTFKGETKSLAEWARISGIRRGTLWDRIIVRNWSAEKALTRAVQ